jgi:hypothetical protein
MLPADNLCTPSSHAAHFGTRLDAKTLAGKMAEINDLLNKKKCRNFLDLFLLYSIGWEIILAAGLRI